MKIVLHIGTEKTGTTSIQEFLNLNHILLMSQGFYFLQSPGNKNNRKLPAALLRPDRFDDYHHTHFIKTRKAKLKFEKQVVQAFIEEIKNLPEGIHTVIASSEHFHSRLIYKDELEKLQSLLSPYFDSIKIIAYIRPQIETAISLYSTALKSGIGDEGLENFLLTHCQKNRYYDYDQFLALWESVFKKENMSVRIFERAFFKEGDLLKDISSLLGFDATDAVLPPKKNESVTPFGQRVLSLCNKHIPRFVDQKGFNQLSAQIHRLVITHCSGKGVLPEKTIAKTLQSQFEASNEEVRKRYFPEREVLFDFDESKYEGFKPEFSESEMSVLEGLLKIAAHSDLNKPQQTPLSQKDINLIRDAALALENSDIEKALDLMRLVNQLRPKGPLVKKKIAEYKKKLKWRLLSPLKFLKKVM